MIRVDQGTEFVSRDLDLWAYTRGVVLDFSRPGKPTDNAFIESFNGKSSAGEPPAVIMIELAPLPVAPESPEQDLAVGPQTVMSEQSTPTERKDEPVEREDPQPEPQRDKATPEPVAREVKTEIETPELPQIDTAAAILETQLKKPAPEPERVEEKKPPEKSKETERSKLRDQAKTAARATSAPKPLPAPHAKTNAAPTSGVSASMSVATWRGAVMAHLNRHKRYPGGGAGGTSSVAFTIDRSGRVLSARLIGSSGSAVLDQEAIALARRASPVPAPPTNIGGGSIVLTVPVRFSR